MLRAAFVCLSLVLTACAASRSTAPVPNLADTTWTMSSLVGAGANNTPQRPTLVFGATYANGRAGCNTWSAAYEQAEGALRFGELIVTTAGCSYGQEAERVYVNALVRTREVRAIDSGLILLDERGRELVRFSEPSSAPSR